jgi:hypothetical protein
MQAHMSSNINCDQVVAALRDGESTEEIVPAIHVGRHRELGELAAVNEIIAAGVSGVRFVVGNTGAGKTHFRLMHSAQQNIVTALVYGLDFEDDQFSQQFSQVMWVGFILSLEIGVHRGLCAITDAIASTLHKKLFREPSTILHRLQSEVPAAAHDVLNAMIQLAFATLDCDSPKTMYTQAWLCGRLDSRLDVVRTLGIRSPMQDAPWVDRMYDVACVLRAFGYSVHRGFC